MICFDLDDTLINTHVRHYQVVLDFLTHEHPGLAASFIGFDEYLNLRKAKSCSNVQVLNHLFEHSFSKESFQNYFSANIESPEYLKYDSLIVELDLLQQINSPLCICSLRTNEENAYRQLESLQITPLFNHIYFLKHSRSENPKKAFFQTHPSITHFIGDSQADNDAVEATNTQFIGVETGFYTISPARLFGDVNQLITQSFLK